VFHEKRKGFAKCVSGTRSLRMSDVGFVSHWNLHPTWRSVWFCDICNGVSFDFVCSFCYVLVVRLVALHKM